MNRRVASFDFALPRAMPMPALYVRYSVAARRFVACTFAAFSRLSLSPPSVCKPLAVLWQLPVRLPGPCLLPGACPPARLLVSVCWSAHWMVGNSVTWLPTRYSDRMLEKHTAAALRCAAPHSPARPKLVLRLITLSCVRRQRRCRCRRRRRRRHRHQKAPRFRRRARRRFPI